MTRDRALRVCIEGVDGSGKTTLIANVKKRLETNGLRVETVTEVGTTPVGTRLRELALHPTLPIHPATRELIFQAIRAELWRVYYPAIETQCDVILSDRGLLSGLAYGLVSEREHRSFPSTTAIQDLLEAAVGQHLITGPDDAPYNLLVFLRGNVRLFERRRTGRAPDAIESKGTKFQHDVQDIMAGYVGAFARRTAVFNAEASPIEIAREVTERIQELL